MTPEQRARLAALVRDASRSLGDAVMLCRELPAEERKVWIARCGKMLGAIRFNAIAPLMALDPDIFPDLKQDD